MTGRKKGGASLEHSGRPRVNIRLCCDNIESEPSAQTFMLWGHPLLSLRPALFIYHAISVGQSVISLLVKSKPEKGVPHGKLVVILYTVSLEVRNHLDGFPDDIENVHAGSG